MQRKKFFTRPSAPQILCRTNNIMVKSDISEHIQNLKENESLTIQGKLFRDTSDEFLKRGPSVAIPVFDKNNPKLMPYELREKAFDSLKSKNILHYNGFTFTPRLGQDMTPRRIRLNDIMEAARIYAYAPLSNEQLPFKSSMQVQAYDSVKGAGSIGATLLVKVPSRIKGQGRYEIKISHLPVVDNDNKYAIAYMFKTNHVCADKQHELQFPTKKNMDYVSEYRIDEHELAAAFALIDYYVNPEFRNIQGQGEKPKQNLVPLQMNLSGIPTAEQCSYYDKLLHKVMIQENPNSKPKILDEGHLEALLWERVIKEGYRPCFFKTGEQKLKDFAWTQYVK